MVKVRFRVRVVGQFWRFAYCSSRFWQVKCKLVLLLISRLFFSKTWNDGSDKESDRPFLHLHCMQWSQATYWLDPLFSNDKMPWQVWKFVCNSATALKDTSFLWHLHVTCQRKRDLLALHSTALYTLAYGVIRRFFLMQSFSNCRTPISLDCKAEKRGEKEVCIYRDLKLRLSRMSAC